MLFALLAANGGLLASLASNTVKASVFVTVISFAIYLAARLGSAGLRSSRRRNLLAPAP